MLGVLANSWQEESLAVRSKAWRKSMASRETSPPLEWFHDYRFLAIGGTNLISNHSAEHYFSIKTMLEEQHQKWGITKSPDIMPPPSSTSCLETTQTFQLWSNDSQSNWPDGYNLSAFHQINGIWPLGHPLPLPDWLPTTNEVVDGVDSSEYSHQNTLHFDSVLQYEEFCAIIEMKLQRMLEETYYDTVHLFIDFYEAFKRTRRSDLRSFFQFYNIPINRRHHMCVSLAMEIMARLIQLFSTLGHYLYIVSCEEQVASVDDYIVTANEFGGLNSPNTHAEKDHAMVAMKINICGRQGVLLLDPGYHVGRVVTVMYDQLYPHTGWFTKSMEPHLQRDYGYKFARHSHKYVEWQEREIRSEKTVYKTSLIYVDQAYVTAVDVTVRRNLVYNFRSLLSRDAKGQVTAGIYLPILANSNEAHFTIFYDDSMEQRVKTKFMFNILKNVSKFPDYVEHHLEKLAPQLNMDKLELDSILRSLTEIIMDEDFVGQVLAINDDISNMSAEN